MMSLLAAAVLSVTLAAPPPLGIPVASTLRDAMLAVERAQATNPTAAQNAALNYNAAVEQYNAHQYERARASALMAISQSAAPPMIAAPVSRAPIAAPAFPGPRYYIVPDEVPATLANAKKYVALAHRALSNCATSQVATEDYQRALSALNAKQFRAAMAASRNLVDDCSVP